MKKNLLTFLVIFLALNLIVSIFFKPGQDQNELKAGEIGMTLSKKDFDLYDLVSVDIKNNTTQAITIKNECPQEPLEVFKYENNEWKQVAAPAPIHCEGTTDTVIQPQEKSTIHYTYWNHALFGEIGRYKIKATFNDKTIESPEFEVKNQGWFGYLWNTLFSQPLYNILIFLIQVAPGKDLGLAIILLTIIIRTILLIPSQNALKSQRKMQEIQPKLAHIKEKHKDNQELLAAETMKIWKEHKVSPFGSCLPLLIQFPVLIALFYVIQSGLNPDNAYLLYAPLKNFTFNDIHTNFLGILELTKANNIVLPLIVGGLQFLQMKLAMIRTAKKNKDQKNLAKPEKNNKLEKKEKSTTTPNEMEMANKMMIYVMPLMIALFTASAPAGVGIYWATSTLYGIAQQVVVNRQSEKEKVKVKVLS